MKIQEKIDYLCDNHFGEWLATRRQADQEVSDEHSMWCICGKLCTGLHEMHCKRFKNKVNSKTVQKLKHLLKATAPTNR